MCKKQTDKWEKVHFALEINQEQHIYAKCKRDILYIWDFCKFLFEMNATQTTKINLIKYTVVIFLASCGLISFVVFFPVCRK